jgi:hypothetical protein
VSYCESVTNWRVWGERMLAYTISVNVCETEWRLSNLLKLFMNKSDMEGFCYFSWPERVAWFAKLYSGHLHLLPMILRVFCPPHDPLSVTFQNYTEYSVELRFICISVLVSVLKQRKWQHSRRLTAAVTSSLWAKRKGTPYVEIMYVSVSVFMVRQIFWNVDMEIF